MRSKTFLPSRKTAKLSIICEYFPEAISLSSPRRTCSSNPTLPGLAVAHPFVGHKSPPAGRAERSPVGRTAAEAKSRHTINAEKSFTLFIGVPVAPYSIAIAVADRLRQLSLTSVVRRGFPNN